MGCEVFLPDLAVSRQHAVIYQVGDKWTLEDLDSANKTYLNGRAIHKSELKHGDKIVIAGYEVEVDLEAVDMHDEMMEDTLVKDTMRPGHRPLNIDALVRKTDSKTASLVIPVKRMKQFTRATIEIGKARDLGGLHRTVVGVLSSQFSAMNSWAGLRLRAGEELSERGGRRMNSSSISADELAAKGLIDEALEKRKYELIPNLPRELGGGKARSAMAAPVLAEGRCYGAVYVENARKNSRYRQSDLDYMIILTVQIAAAIQEIRGE